MNRDQIQKVLSALIELEATMRGECPGLLDEDSGGSALLGMEVEDAIKILTEAMAAAPSQLAPVGREQDAKDAARYQWLRQSDNDELVLQNKPINMSYWYLPRNEKLDEMIDAAIAAAQKESS